jgi:hypothetical protein
MNVAEIQVDYFDRTVYVCGDHYNMRANNMALGSFSAYPICQSNSTPWPPPCHDCKESEIREACNQIMGGNCSFVDDDFARCLLKLRDDNKGLADRLGAIRERCENSIRQIQGDGVSNYGDGLIDAYNAILRILESAVEIPDREAIADVDYCSICGGSIP